MPSDRPQYTRICQQGLVDPVYDLGDQNFPQKLDFRPHKPGPDYFERCKVIPRFYGFKTLSQADMKERKRVLVQESEFQGQKNAMNGKFSALEIPVYKGIILEKRQQPLTGKETFDGKLVSTMTATWGLQRTVNCSSHMTANSTKCMRCTLNGKNRIARQGRND